MGLQSLLQQVEVNGEIGGVAIYRNGPRISHVFFADDSVIFCHATKA